jgi:hypothetical protein
MSTSGHGRHRVPMRVLAGAVAGDPEDVAAVLNPGAHRYLISRLRLARSAHETVVWVELAQPRAVGSIRSD